MAWDYIPLFTDVSCLESELHPTLDQKNLNRRFNFAFSRSFDGNYCPFTPIFQLRYTFSAEPLYTIRKR
jgi:hypothetical protein